MKHKEPIDYPETTEEALRCHPLIGGTEYLIELFAEKEKVSHCFDQLKLMANENPLIYSREEFRVCWDMVKEGSTQISLLMDDLEKSGKIRFK